MAYSRWTAPVEVQRTACVARMPLFSHAHMVVLEARSKMCGVFESLMVSDKNLYPPHFDSLQLQRMLGFKKRTLHRSNHCRFAKNVMRLKNIKCWCLFICLRAVWNCATCFWLKNMDILCNVGRSGITLITSLVVYVLFFFFLNERSRRILFLTTEKHARLFPVAFTWSCNIFLWFPRSSQLRRWFISQSTNQSLIWVATFRLQKQHKVLYKATKTNVSHLTEDSDDHSLTPPPRPRPICESTSSLSRWLKLMKTIWSFEQNCFHNRVLCSKNRLGGVEGAGVVMNLM